MESNSKKNFWDSKPFWCQPWSIISFGLLVLTFSWILFKNVIISLIICILVIIWWILFLILVPSSYNAISENK